MTAVDRPLPRPNDYPRLRPEYEICRPVVFQDGHLFMPPIQLLTNANLTAFMLSKGFETYDELYDWSIAHPEDYWADQASMLHWFKSWETVFKWTEEPRFEWFSGGTTNICFNCLDRHKGTPTWSRTAFYWEAEDEVETASVTFAELYRQVNRFARVLIESGVKRGDNVTIYMSRCLEQVVAMLAVARIGAVHSVIFSGFASHSIAERVRDAHSETIITIDGYHYNGKHIDLKSTVDEALEQVCGVKRVIVVRRSSWDVLMKEGRDFYYHDMMARVPEDAEVPCAEMDAEDPLFILYTSGSTGKPKGVVHVHGGYSVGCYSTCKYAFDLKESDVYWCTADPGWITGHSCVVYGPLMNGVTSVLYEGGMINPDPGRWWSLIEKYRVTLFFTAPTGIRALMRQGEEYAEQYDLSSLRLLASAGEPMNPEAWLWLRRVTGNRAPVIDNWWMTEGGAMLISGTPVEALKPGSCTRPLPGIEADVVTSDGQPVGPDRGGFLVIRRPWPYMMRGVYGDPERFALNWNVIPNVYFTNDAARKDADGYFWVQGRVDDVINVSGHRLGSAEIELSLVNHPAVAEAAAIGLPDPLTGEQIMVYIVARRGYVEDDRLIADLKAHVRHELGPVATPKLIKFATALPKTRSGKVLRRLLRAREMGEDLGDISTLEG